MASYNMDQCQAIINPPNKVKEFVKALSDTIGKKIYDSTSTSPMDKKKVEMLLRSVSSVPKCMMKDDLPHIYTWDDTPLDYEEYKSVVDKTKVKHNAYKSCSDDMKCNKNKLINSNEFNEVCHSFKSSTPPKKIIMSMTSSPDRLKTIHYILECFYDELVNILDVIYIVLPYYFRNNTTNTYTIHSKLLEKYSKVRFLSVEVDIGPASKIIHAVEYEKQICDNSDDFIFVSIDDDMNYPAYCINEVINPLPVSYTHLTLPTKRIV